MMDEKRCTTDELVRIVGAEQGSNALGDVAAVEKELIRRLGGTRNEALRRNRSSGIIILSLGVLLCCAMLVMGISILGGSAARQEGGSDFVIACVALGLGLLLGGFIFWYGLSAATLKKFPDVSIGAHRTCIPITHKGLWPEEVVSVIAAGRASHTPDEVAEAEADLQQLRCEAHERVLKRMLAGARDARVLGVLLGITAGIFLLVFSFTGLTDTAEWRGGPGVPTAGAINYYGTLVFVLFFTFFGWWLYFLGRGLGHRREAARKGLQVAIWVFLAVECVGGFLGGVKMFLEADASGCHFSLTYAEVCLNLTYAAVTLFLLALIFRRITRFLRSPEVVELFSVPGKDSASPQS